VNDQLLSAGDRLHIRFTRRGDRWDHAIRLQNADGLIWQIDSAAEATSVESSGIAAAIGQHWPASPPFQSLELHTEPDGRQFALLVGMAGASHWSASVEADPVAERLVFDVACRIKNAPEWLGSSYAMAAFAADGGRPLADSLLETSVLAAIVKLEGPSYDSTKLEIAKNRLRICVGELSGPLPRTVRWKYAISAAAAAQDAGLA